jgi:isopenicillin N synthase-like dioxygenase
MPDIETPSYGAATRVDFDQIPVVDLALLDQPDALPAIAAELVDAARNVGFFYVKNHGIDAAICARALAASRQFFALGDAEKASIAVDQHQRGWMALGMANLEGGQTHDAKEVFFWGRDVGSRDADVLAGLALIHPNQWPNETAPFLQPGLLPYYDAVMALGRRLMGCLALGLGQSRDLFEQAYEKPLGRGQLVYYPPLETADITAMRFGAASHSDFGALTVLMQDNLGGLQVQNRAGEWIEAMPIADTFVCNIGDLLEHWTNGRLVSTKHRVLNRSKAARFSIPIFCDPASDAVVDPTAFDQGSKFPGMLAGADRQPIQAGVYIMAKNKKNFAQYEQPPTTP